jgi:hypothetical protein
MARFKPVRLWVFQLQLLRLPVLQIRPWGCMRGWVALVGLFSLGIMGTNHRGQCLLLARLMTPILLITSINHGGNPIRDRDSR